jgi:hypothetical protein
MYDFDINNYLTKNYFIILDELSNKNKFIKFIEYINNNFNKIKLSKLELLIKIILKKIIDFDGKLDNKEFYKFYDNIKDEDNKELINNFINFYDNLEIINKNYKLIIFILVKSFKDYYIKLKDIDVSSKLDNILLEKIDCLIEFEIYKHYNSFFELNLNRVFFKRLKECKDENVKIIYTNEMISRLIGLRKIFSLELIEILDIKKITIDNFYKLEYLERVNYFLNFYNKTNNIFKIFLKILSFKKRFNLRINDLIEISQLDYLDSLTDSDDINPGIFCILDQNEINEVKDLSSSDEEEYVDTPYFDISNIFIKSEKIDNEESFGDSNSSSESDGEN